MVDTHINKNLKKTGKNQNVIIQRQTYGFLKMSLGIFPKLSDFLKWVSIHKRP